MNRVIAQEIKEKVRKQLEPLCDEYGVKFELGKGRWNELLVRFQIKIYDETVDDDGNEQTPESYKYREKAIKYGLKQSWLFAKFHDKPRPRFPIAEMQVIGLRPTLKKRPVIVKEVKTGKLWTYSVKSLVKKLDTTS